MNLVENVKNTMSVNSYYSVNYLLYVSKLQKYIMIFDPMF